MYKLIIDQKYIVFYINTGLYIGILAMNQNDYYYVSVGEKSYFYTLNFSYMDTQYRKVGDEQKVVETKVRKHTFLRNLSHDFSEAMTKAQEWHKGLTSEIPLVLLDSPHAMSAREQGLLEQRLAAIKAGYLPVGKYANQHVSSVEKSYIHWVVLNIYDPDLADDSQNLMAQICYNYADEQGWIEEWVKNGQDTYFDPDYEDVVNNIINGDVFLVGQYRNESIQEFGFTQKGKIKVSVLNYLQWFAKQKIYVDEVVDRFSLPLELMEDGKEYYVLRSEHFTNVKSGKPQDFDLTVLMVRHFLASKGFTHPLYRFKWTNRILPLKHALALSTCE